MFRFLEGAFLRPLVILIPMVLCYVTVRELYEIMVGLAAPIADLMPRFGGFATMSRLPGRTDTVGLDVALTSVSLDIGTGNWSSTGYGPCQIRGESVLVRPYGVATGAAPFNSLQVADLGNIAINPYGLLPGLSVIPGARRPLAPLAETLQ